ncbi:N-acetyltransferase family protein [Nocardia thailandica]
MTRALRPATAADAEALGGLLTELHAHYGKSWPAVVQVRLHRAWFPGGEVARPAPLLVLDDDVPVGFAVYGLPSTYGGSVGPIRITEFGVAGSALGTGVGAALYSRLERIAAQLGSRLEAPAQAAPDVFVTVERYVHPSLIDLERERADAARWADLRALCADKGWPPPRYTNLWKTYVDHRHGDLLAEGEVPFVELSDGRLVTARFRTIWKDDRYLGPDAVTGWSLALADSALRSLGALSIEFGWSLATKRPAVAVRGDDGIESVTYPFYEGSHFGSSSGTVTYRIDPLAGTVACREDLTFERD